VFFCGSVAANVMKPAGDAFSSSFEFFFMNKNHNLNQIAVCLGMRSSAMVFLSPVEEVNNFAYVGYSCAHAAIFHPFVLIKSADAVSSRLNMQRPPM